MTFLDLAKLLKHYAKVVLLILSICIFSFVLIGAEKAFIEKPEFTATASLTISEPTATVSSSELMPLAQAIAKNIVKEIDGSSVALSTSSEAGTRVISFSAISDNESTSADAANQAALMTVEAIEKSLHDMAASQRDALGQAGVDEIEHPDPLFVVDSVGYDSVAALEAVSFTINDAVAVSSETGPAMTLAKYACIGIVIGCFISVCVVVTINFSRSPVKGREDLESTIGIPFLANFKKQKDARILWANIQFVMNSRPSSVCLVPVGFAVPESLRTGLESAATDCDLSLQDDGSNLTVITGLPLNTELRILFDARDAEATVLCVRMWKDSITKTVNTLKELELTGANTVGFILY